MANSDEMALISYLKIGELRKALSLIEKCELNSDISLKCVICCCIACSSKLNNFSPEDLLIILKLCLQSIHEIPNKFSNEYVRSVYFIWKYFIEQNMAEHVLELQVLCLPNFTLHLSEEKNRIAYEKSCNLLHNFILKLFEQNDKVEANDFLNVCLLYFKMWLELSPSVLLSKKMNSFYHYCLLFGVKVIDLYEAHMSILSLVQSKKGSEDLTASTIRLAAFFVKPLINEKRFLELKDLINYSLRDCSDKVCSIIKEITKLVENERNYLTKQKVIEILSSTTNQITILSELDEINEATSFFCHNLLFQVVKSYEHFSIQFWADVSEDFHFALYRLVVCISKIVCKKKLKCSCGECRLGKNLAEAFTCSTIGPLFFNEHLAKITDFQLSDDLMQKFKNVLDLSYGFILKSKQNGCSHWKKMWQQLAPCIYNITIYATKLKVKQKIYLKELFVKYLLQLEGKNKSIVKDGLLQTSLLSLAVDYFEEKEAEKALATTALNILLNRSDGKNLFLMWVKVKSNFKTDLDLQHLTLVTAFAKCEFVEEEEIRLDAKIDLLKFELYNYKAIWPSKISVKSALNELFSLTDIVTTTKALANFWDVSPMHLDISDLIGQMLQVYKKQALTNEAKIYLACLHFIHYNIGSGNKQSKVLHENPKNEPSSADSDDECDINPTNEFLELKILKPLNKALKLFQENISQDVVGILIEDNNIYDILKEIVFEYRLHCHTLEYFQACFCCLEVAKLTCNDAQTIATIGNIIEKANLQSDATKALMEYAEQRIPRLEENVAKWEALVQYYVSKSLAYLSNAEVETAIKLFENAKEAIARCSCESKLKQLLEFRLDYLQWLLFLLPCEYKIEGHCTISLAKPILILHDLDNYYLKAVFTSSHFKAIMFEVYTAVVNNYLWLRLPRETRCYGKQILKLSQWLIVPLQTVKILSLLAQADILICRIDDCLVKINGMSQILCDSQLPRCEKEAVKHGQHTDVKSLTKEFDELMLNVPSSFQMQNVGSPVLEANQFQLPFLTHSSTCKCFHCMSVDYQKFTLTILNLCGQVNILQSNFSQANEYYNNAVKIYQHFTSREGEFRRKVSNLINGDVFPSIKKIFLEPYCSILISIGHDLIGKVGFASINEEIFELLEDTKDIYPHVYNEAYLQLMLHKYALSGRSKLGGNISPVVQTTEDVAFHTPKSGMSTVCVENTDLNVSPFERRKPTIKILKFDSSDEDDEEDKGGVDLEKERKIKPSKTIIRKSATTTKKNKQKLNLNINNLKIESDQEEACALSPTSASSVSNSTKLLTEKLKTTSKQSKQKLNLNVAFRQIDDNQEEACALSPTSSSSVIKSTKLLTEKLKTENKKTKQKLNFTKSESDMSDQEKAYTTRSVSKSSKLLTEKLTTATPSQEIRLLNSEGITESKPKRMREKKATNVDVADCIGKKGAVKKPFRH